MDQRVQCLPVACKLHAVDAQLLWCGVAVLWVELVLAHRLPDLLAFILCASVS
jgi:hypothetical protein